MRQDGPPGEFEKALLNRLMAAEFAHHSTQDRATSKGKNQGNGSTGKRALADDSDVAVTTPRDREACFDPDLIGTYQRRLPGFDDKLIMPYTRSMSNRERFKQSKASTPHYAPPLAVTDVLHRRGGGQTAVSGFAPAREKVERRSTRIDRCHDTVRDHVRRPMQHRVKRSSGTDPSHKFPNRAR